MEPLSVVVVDMVRLLGEEAAIALNASGKFKANLLVPPLEAPLLVLPPSSLVLVHLYTHRALMEQTMTACRQLARAEKLRILFVVYGPANHDPVMLQAALALRSIGLLDGNSLCFETLWTALQTVAAGNTLWQPEQLQLAAMAPPDQSHPLEQLTRREQDVMRFLVEGLNDQAIAERLSVSVRTVHFHVHNVLQKLGVNCRTEAVALMLREPM